MRLYAKSQSNSKFSPAQSLAQRLLWGGSPDQELLDRAANCRDFFNDEPVAALRWRRRLLEAARAAELAGGRNLWALVEPIVYGSQGTA